jgi:hypothetical protein
MPIESDERAGGVSWLANDTTSLKTFSPLFAIDKKVKRRGCYIDAERKLTTWMWNMERPTVANDRDTNKPEVLSVLRFHHIKSSGRTTMMCACVRQNNLGPCLFTQRLVIFAVLPIIRALVFRSVGLLRARYPRTIALTIKSRQRRRKLAIGTVYAKMIV